MGLEISNFQKVFKFSKKILKKKTNNVISRKLQGFEQSNLEKKLATPERASL